MTSVTNCPIVIADCIHFELAKKRITASTIAVITATINSTIPIFPIEENIQSFLSFILGLTTFRVHSSRDRTVSLEYSKDRKPIPNPIKHTINPINFFFIFSSPISCIFLQQYIRHTIRQEPLPFQPQAHPQAFLPPSPRHKAYNTVWNPVLPSGNIHR